MRQLLEPVLSAADASVDEAGAAIPTANIFAASLQAVVTGTSTGTLKLQYSNDVIPVTNPLTEPTNWSDIPSATVAIAGAGVYSIPKTDICYEYTRAVFTATNAEAGTLDAVLKGLGA